MNAERSTQMRAFLFAGIHVFSVRFFFLSYVVAILLLLRLAGTHQNIFILGAFALYGHVLMRVNVHNFRRAQRKKQTIFLQFDEFNKNNEARTGT